MEWTYENTKNGYSKLWNSISIKPTDAKNAARFASKIIAGEDAYTEVQTATGVPWYFIGALHMRESSCNFDGVLHNGEKIIGTDRKTVLVPAGRGPFSSWSEAAIDALGMKQSFWLGREWCPSLMGYVSEVYNGKGYIGHKTNSPYCWAGSNHEQSGKYVADHVWDPNFDDPQVGVLTVIKALCSLRPDISQDMQEALPEVTGVSKHITVKNVAATTAVVGAGAGAASQSQDAQDAITSASSTLDVLMPIVNMFQAHGTLIATAFTVSVVVGTVAWHFYEKYQDSKA